jgi:hypothetical protein
VFFRTTNRNLAPAKAILDLHQAAAKLPADELASEIQILLHRLGPTDLFRVQKTATDLAWGDL